MAHICSDDGFRAMRPCLHNDWDDVRTRKGLKVLRCRICQERWKLPSRSLNRCMAFLHDCCEDGPTCGLIHVRKKKCNIGERYDLFGDSVLKGVARSIRRKTKRQAAALRIIDDISNEGHSGNSSSSTAEKVNSTELSSSSSVSGNAYAHSPYSWGGSSPPDFV
eukprot:TRINITY_DN6780_c0_g1_i2.p1 TRINITY_DN6780_c0_g1~~TRINITY_DN6780_c0_g1_i2.p1  ORF type:complete len:164 (+),score=28.59 TRINITY_DN6780_c0_g1_i2:59-550(+)